MTSRHGPSAQVLDAFGVGDVVSRERLAGGRGLTWRVGRLVLRPSGGSSEACWRAGVLDALEHTDEFRTPRPVRTASGAWVVDGWEAWSWVPGAADESRVSDVLRAADAFHRAIAGLGKPSFIDAADDPWARADRMAWGEDPLPHDPTLDRLAARFRPVESARQVIHGDLLGNVLFADGEPPAIIDWAPYWRPAGLGAAIAVVDAVTWHSTPMRAIAGLGAGVPEWSQLVVRALAFRIATFHLLGRWDRARSDRYAPLVDAVLTRT
ncbi:hypothetical protein [Isoptericola sp. NPDC019482]|uniref:hypothetical protein n=1 Tax=Isoptericola sp. NPDC019482 TaxID=3154688 RepID=UPI00348735BB